MSMLKLAQTNLDILDVFSNPNDIRPNVVNGEDSKKAIAQFKNTIKLAKAKLKKSEDFSYIRTRAIGSMEKWGPNGNGDGFPLKELQASYKTFIGKGNFIDHQSDDITKIRGLVVDAFMNNNDESVECLIAVDKKSHPQLARDLETGVVNSVSMGTRVGYSNCSVCGHMARTENEYCDHIRNYKGMKIGWLTNNAAHKYGAWPVHELNYDLEFIELSWVAVPAFKEANILEKLASLKSAVIDGNHTNTASSINNPELLAHTKSEAEAEIIELAKINSQTPAIPEALKQTASAAECRDTECDFDIRKSNKNRIKEITAMQRIKIDIKELSLRKPSKDFAAKGSVAIDTKNYEWKAVSGDKRQWFVSFDLDILDIFSSQGIGQISKAIEELLGKNVDTTELVVASLKNNTKTAYLQNQNEDPNMSEYINDRYQEDAKRKEMIYPNKNLEVPGVGDVRDAEYKAYSGAAAEGPAGKIGETHAVNENTSKQELEYKKELHRAYLNYKLIKEAAEEVVSEEEISNSPKKSFKNINQKYVKLDDLFYGADPFNIVSEHVEFDRYPVINPNYQEDDLESEKFIVDPKAKKLVHDKDDLRQMKSLAMQMLQLVDEVYDLRKELLNQLEFPSTPKNKTVEQQRLYIWNKPDDDGENQDRKRKNCEDIIENYAELFSGPETMLKTVRELQRYKKYLEVFLTQEGSQEPDLVNYDRKTYENEGVEAASEEEEEEEEDEEEMPQHEAAEEQEEVEEQEEEEEEK